jgi:hypothetical protein
MEAIKETQKKVTEASSMRNLKRDRPLAEENIL